jgi:hypothetical protein
LFLSFGLNFLRPQLASAPPAFGMGGGGGVEETFSVQSAAATELPAPTEPPAATEAPAAEMAPMPTATISPAEDTARALETPLDKAGEPANGVEPLPGQVPSPAIESPLVSSVWQWLLAGIALISAFIMAMMRQLSINRWRKK